jgi:hypothetical protein
MRPRCTMEGVDVRQVVTPLPAIGQPARADDLDALLQPGVLLSAAPAARLPAPGPWCPAPIPVLVRSPTYRCQNRCTFCYASAPDRGRKVPAMSTAEVRR